MPIELSGGAQKRKTTSAVNEKDSGGNGRDMGTAARDALNRVQQELVTKEIEQKVKLEMENEKITGKTERLRGIRGRRNESTKQFEHETKCDLRAEVRYGATRMQITINNLSSGTPGNQKSE